MAAQTGARREGAADLSRKDGPSRADLRQRKTRRGRWWWGGEHALPLLQSGHSRADWCQKETRVEAGVGGRWGPEYGSPLCRLDKAVPSGHAMCFVSLLAL